jgi:small subunit ribosomal protein S6
MATAAAAPATKLAREYETIYILRPDVDNETAEKVVERAKDVIARLDGTLTKLDNWGKRKLAYPIRKNSRGIFVYLKYVGFSDLVAELERNLRLVDQVMRFQTVLLDEDLDPAAVAVDPEELQYLHVEDEEEAEDAELERARSLGMAPRAPREEAPSSEEDAPPAEEAAAASDEGSSEEGSKPEESDSETTVATEEPAAAAEATAAEDAPEEATKEEG